MAYSRIVGLAERYDRTLGKLDAATIEKLDAALDRAYRELTEAVGDNWGDLVANKSIIPQQQRVLLLDQLGDLLQVVRPQDRAKYEALFRRAIARGDALGSEFSDRVNAALQPGAEQGALLRATNGVPLEALAFQVQRGVKAIAGLNATQESQVLAILEQGLAQSWGSRRVIAAIESVAGLTKSKAQGIALTEINSAFNGAAIARAAEGDALVQWLAVGDSRTCPSCVYRQMRIYRPGDIHIPAHPRCRCVAVPIRREWLSDPGVITDADLAFMVDYRQDSLDILRATGQKPRRDAPFDGPTPPSPVWTPSLQRSLL